VISCRKFKCDAARYSPVADDPLLFPLYQIKNELFKLGDFGLVSTISSHDVEEGDSRYMSIELLSGDHADLTKSDIFSLGITMYELCLGGRPLPSNGPEWQALRSANIPQNLPDTPGEMQRILELMMNPSFGARPSASDLLKRPQLLSFEQKALLAERNKVVEANLALAAQANRFRKLPPIPPRIPPPPRLLVRASTWNGSL
jgi:serine/threonine protein kinase